MYKIAARNSRIRYLFLRCCRDTQKIVVILFKLFFLNTRKMIYEFGKYRILFKAHLGTAIYIFLYSQTYDVFGVNGFSDLSDLLRKRKFFLKPQFKSSLYQ
jgi:hypothetical protein